MEKNELAIDRDIKLSYRANADLAGRKIVYISLTNGAGGAEQILLMSAKVTGSPIVFLKRVSSSALSIDNSNEQVKFLNGKSILLGFFLLLIDLNKYYRSDFIIISSHPYLNAFLGTLKRIGFIRSRLITRECTSVFLRFAGLKRLSYKMVYTLGYPAVNLLVCQTNEMKLQLLANLPFLTANKVIVQENPVDIQAISEKAQLAVDDSIFKKHFICSAGRLMTLKGFDNLILAFAKVYADYPNVTLIILGEGEERINLQNLINRLGLNEHVILKGFVSNPFPYFKKAQVCVVSSIKEGFPNVLLQMMALNGSVVSTLCADGIEKFDSVRKVNVNDISGLANAIEAELIDRKPFPVNRNSEFVFNRTPSAFINSILNRVD